MPPLELSLPLLNTVLPPAKSITVKQGKMVKNTIIDSVYDTM